MRYLLIILFILSSTFAFSQEQNQYLHLKNISDTTDYIYSCHKRDVRLANAEDLEKCAHKFHFRLIETGRYIDILTMDSSHYIGVLTKHAYEYVRDENPTHRVYSEHDTLTDQEINKLLSIIYSTDILQMPDGDDIKGWFGMLDGWSVSIEIAQSEIYSYKNYHSPGAYKSVKEAQIVQKFVDSCFKIASRGFPIYKFKEEVPFESYQRENGGISVIKNIRDAEQVKKYKMERDWYRITRCLEYMEDY